MVRRLSHDLTISKRRAALYQSIVTWVVICIFSVFAWLLHDFIERHLGHVGQLALINAIGAIGGVQAGVIVYRWRGLYVAEAEAKSHT
jgi:hypothetical protein